MPMLELTFATPRPAAPDLIRRLAAAAKDLTVSHLKKREPLVTVAVTQVPAAGWFVGGVDAAASGKAGYHLTVAVTAGTNTKAEIADFIAAADAAFAKLLGPIAPASYVELRELPAADWGYAGLTQEHRYVAERIEAETRRANVVTAFERYGIR